MANTKGHGVETEEYREKMDKEHDPLASEARDGQEFPSSEDLTKPTGGRNDVPEKDGKASDASEPDGLQGSLHGNWTRPDQR
jgi:hypothetical protein